MNNSSSKTIKKILIGFHAATEKSQGASVFRHVWSPRLFISARPCRGRTMRKFLRCRLDSTAVSRFCPKRRHDILRQRCSEVFLFLTAKNYQKPPHVKHPKKTSNLNFHCYNEKITLKTEIV